MFIAECWDTIASVEDPIDSGSISFGLTFNVFDRSELKWLDPTTFRVVNVYEEGCAFWFRLIESLTDRERAMMELDALEGVYVASAFDTRFVAVRDFHGPLNVKWFGAKADGISDDSPVFNAAFAMSGAVYAPAGTYKLNGTVCCYNKAVRFSGDGKGITRLVFGSVDVGLNFDNLHSGEPIDVVDMSVLTIGIAAGTAIQIVFAETWYWRMVHKGTVRGVQIEGVTNTENGWLKGVTYRNAVTVTIDDCGILGIFDPEATQAGNSRSYVGIQFSGGVYPVELRISKTVVNCFHYAVYIDGAPEGITLHQFTTLFCRVGVWYVPTVFADGIGGGSAKFRPLLNISDSHLAVFEAGVITDGLVQSFFHDNLFYANALATQPVSLLQIGAGGGIMIHHNQFYSYATNHCTTGMRFINTNDGVVSDNIFGSMDNGIWFDHTTGEGSVQRHNVFQGSFTNQVLDQR